jgi:DNA-binding response OmpR family regulator
MESTTNQLTSPQRILGIEDDATELLLIDRALKSARVDASIEWAKTAAQARALLDDKIYDLILVDHSLGEITSGIDLWADSVERGENLPFVFVTSLPYDQFLRLVGSHRIAPPYVAKPIRPGEIAQVITAYLDAANARRC